MMRGIKHYIPSWLIPKILFIAFSMTTIAFFMHGCGKMYRPPDSGPIAIKRPEGNLDTIIISVLAQPPLNLKVRSSQSGVIITEHESFEGELHGFLWWKKRWQERTSYTITVTAGWSPEIIQIMVDAYTEQRPNSKYPWEPYDTAKNSQRATKVLNMLVEKLGAGYGG